MFSKATLLFVALSALELSVSALPSDHHIRRSHHHAVNAAKRDAVKVLPGSKTARAKRQATSCRARSTSSAPPAVSTGASNATVTSAASSAKFTSVHTSSSDSSDQSSSSSTSTQPSATSSASTASSSSSSGGSVLSNLLAALFPSGGSTSDTSSAWSTVPDVANTYPLSDGTFDISHDMSELTHNYVSAPDGSTAMQAIYKEGSYQLTHAPYGGISFYASGPSAVDLSNAKEATLGYSIWFEDGFGYQLGGKLPGLYGGNDQSTAYGCSGGSRNDACFSARLMWRTDGAGELYTYLPPSYSANNGVCDIKPFSTCNPTYGASVGRGSFTFQTGAWNTVTQRVKLNDAGSENGELQVWFNGESVINVGGLVLRDSDDGRIWGIMMQTFFGGSTEEYASPKTQDAYFKDFTVAILDTL